MKLRSGPFIFAAFLLLYGLTPTGYSTFDAVSYANQIAHLYPRTGDLRWLFHPHHLLFNALGYLLWRGAAAWGYRGGPLIVLERLNALCGAAGPALLFAIVQRVSPAKAAVAAVGLGLSFGWWVCATDGRVNPPALALLLAAFLAIGRLTDAPTRRRAALTGILSGLAVLFHESAGLFVLVAAAAAWLAGDSAPTRRALLAVTLTAWAAVVAVPYLCVGVFALGLHSPAAFHQWSNRYAELGWWWDFHVGRDLQLDGYALRRAMFADLPRAAPLWMQALSVISLGGGLALLAVFLAAVRKLRSSPQRPLQQLCLLWIGLYGVFFTFWTPDYFVFKLYVLLPVAIFIGLSEIKMPAWAAALAWAWVICYGTLNFAASIRPHLSSLSSPYFRVASAMRAHLRPGDVIVVTGAGNLAQCEVDIPYYADREVVSLHALLTRAHDDRAAAWAQAQAAMNAALQSGHAVYALDEVWNGRRAWADLHRHHPTVTRADGAALMSPYARVPAWADSHGGVWRLSRRQNGVLWMP